MATTHTSGAALVVAFILFGMAPWPDRSARAERLPQYDLVPAYYEAVNRGDYRIAASLIDRPSASALQEEINRLLVTENAAGGDALLHALFGNDANLVDGMRADPVLFYERMLALRYRRLAAGSETPASVQILGHVQEHADTLHIVVREETRTDDGLWSTPRVMTARENREGWRLVVPYELWATLHEAKRRVAAYVADRLRGRTRPQQTAPVDG